MGASQTALYHQLRDEFETALTLYGEAEELYFQSPLNRDQCRIGKARCQLALGRSTRAEYHHLVEEMKQRYPSHRSLLRELELTEVWLHSHMDSRAETIRLSTELLEKEVRHFERAKLLQFRAKAHLSIDATTDAARDLNEVLHFVPQSYLAEEAQKVLSTIE